jgi:hypothetical protein
MSYRSEYNKIYNKINNIAKKGKDAIFDYYIFIDEIIDNGQYAILQDVLVTKYNIVAKNFKSIQDLKHKTFSTIRSYTNSSNQVELKKLFDSKNVYSIGYHFFNKTNNKFLGDIKEVEESEDWIAYKDPKLTEKEDEIRIINLEVVTGLSQSTLESIPQFENNPNRSISFATSSQVIYFNNIYECSQTYTYNINNQITPTYSSYWTQKLAPTYSFTLIDDSTIKLFDKYSTAIDLIKSYNYRDI